MKILHTSDWHLGHTLYNYDRTEEQLNMLQQMEKIVRDEKPDVFLLAGDVYHTAQPSAAIQTVFADFIIRLHTACPLMTMVITAGNHDSGTKHDIFRTPWKTLNVYTVGTINKENPDEHIIYIPDKGFIIAVPYTNERNIPDNFYRQLLNSVKQQNTMSLPVVLTAHTTVKGCDITGHDNHNEYSVGGIDYTEIEQFGTGYDYLALGHIHHAQFVHTGKHNVRYSGSPLPVSFDETYQHSVSIAEITSNNSKPDIRTVDIDNPRPLVSLPNNSYTTWDNAIDLLKSFPDDIPAYIRLQVTADDIFPTDANAIAADLVKDKKCRFCYISSVKHSTANNSSQAITIQDFQNKQPIDIAARYAEDTGWSFDNELQQLFRLAQKEVENDLRS